MVSPACRAPSWRSRLRDALFDRASRHNSRWVSVPAFSISISLSTRDHVPTWTHAISGRSFTGGFSTAYTNSVNIASPYASRRERRGAKKVRHSFLYRFTSTRSVSTLMTSV